MVKMEKHVMQIKKTLIIFISLLVLGSTISSFGMDQKRTGKKRKRSPENADQGKKKKKRKTQIAEEISGKEKKQKILPEKKESKTCSICYCEDDKIKKLKNCRHFFHPSCVGSWFKAKNTCPNCREPEFCFSCKKIFVTDDHKIERESCKHVFHHACFSKQIEERCPLCPSQEQEEETDDYGGLFVQSENFKVTISGDIAQVFDIRRNRPTVLQLPEDKAVTNLDIVADIIVVVYADNTSDAFDGINNFVKLSLQNKAIKTCNASEQFFFMVYADCEADIFNFGDINRKYTVQLQKKEIVNVSEIYGLFWVRHDGGFVDAFNPTNNFVKVLLQDKAVKSHRITDGFLIITYDDDKCDFFDLMNKFEKLPLQDKRMKNHRCMDDFLMITYQDNEVDVFDAENKKKCTVQLQSKTVHNWMIMNKRFLMVFYRRGMSISKTFEVFDFGSNGLKFTGKLKDEDIFDCNISNNRFLVVQYKEDFDSIIPLAGIDIFDLKHDRKKYTIQIKQKTFDKWIIVNMQFVVAYEDCEITAYGLEDGCEKYTISFPHKYKNVSDLCWETYDNKLFSIVEYMDEDTVCDDMDIFENGTKYTVHLQHKDVLQYKLGSDSLFIAAYDDNTVDVIDFKHNNKTYNVRLLDKAFEIQGIKDNRFLEVTYEGETTDFIDFLK